MSKSRWVAVIGGFFGLLGLYALCQENIVRYNRGDLDAWNIWSHFTYQSNLIAVVALLASSFAIWRGVESRTLDQFRGAATLYMIITGVVYIALVNNADPAVMADHYIMHYVMPVVMVVAWLYHRPAWRMPYEETVCVWIAYPLLYAAYVLGVYGRITGDYLYGFLDLNEHSLASVGLTILGLTVASCVVAFGMMRLPLRRVVHRV